MSQSQAYICDAIRTPFGRYGGALSSVRADDLGAIPIKALMDRNPGVDWAAVTDVLYGCANQAGEDNRNVAHMSSLLAGLPIDVHASHQSLTFEGVALFNQRYPQGLPLTWGGQGPAEVDGVRYYSWSGTLQPGITDSGRNRFDGSNRFCRLFARTFVREPGQCDGMVGRFSSHLGQVIGDDYPLDHLDIVNQSLGAVGKGADPVRLFTEHAARLKAAGL